MKQHILISITLLGLMSPEWLRGQNFPGPEESHLIRQQQLALEYLLDVFIGNHEACWTNYAWDPPQMAYSNRNSFMALLKHFRSTRPYDFSTLDFLGREMKQDEDKTYRYFKFTWIDDKGNHNSPYTYYIGMPPGETNKIHRISYQLKPRKK